MIMVNHTYLVQSTVSSGRNHYFDLEMERVLAFRGDHT